MKSSDDIDELLARDFSKESLTDDQQATLNEWKQVHHDEYVQLRHLVEAQTDRGSGDFDRVKAWQKVEARLQTPHAVNVPFLYKMAALAASVMLVVAFSLFLFKREKPILMAFTNTESIQRMVTLPDSSQLTLYPGSKVTYKAFQSKGERELDLNGKVFFQIKRNVNRPFVIHTYNIKVEVLGTSFLVDSKARNDARVYVKSGTVRVTADARNVVLQKNQQAEVTEDKIVTGEISNAPLLFDDVPQTLNLQNAQVSGVIKQLEGIYHVQIDLDKGIASNKITTQLELKELETILKELSYLCNCKYEKISVNHYRLYYE